MPREAFPVFRFKLRSRIETTGILPRRGKLIRADVVVGNDFRRLFQRRQRRTEHFGNAPVYLPEREFLYEDRVIGKTGEHDKNGRSFLEARDDTSDSGSKKRKSKYGEYEE